MRTAERRVLELVQSGEVTSSEGWAMLRALTGAPTRPDTDPAPPEPARGEPIAIVGASANYPGAPDLDGFWDMLDGGASMVREIPASRWDAEGLYSPKPGLRGRITSKWGGLLDGIDRFDPAFFNLSGRAAELMDPQQRLFLKGAWRALEDAGAAGSARMPERCGVFVGATEGDYLGEEERSGARAEAMTLLGGDTSILAARISYLLDLRGPSLALNTACSSSLVAVDLGCTSLRAGQTDLVLAGGVCLFIGPSFYLGASEGQMLSPTGACRAFDAAADGFVPGEGVGVVVLKRLSDALEQGDRIRGVIRASGVNQDGKSNGLTAPSARAQEELEREVYGKAGVSAETITMVEAHGTGTRLGDPVEVAALTGAFRADTDRSGFCALGSVKTNIGHTAQAAGVAGILKVLLAMQHRRIPATLNFDRLNPQLELAGSPFYIADAARPWHPPEDAPRRAVVSSFGYSGTNAHLLLEEPPAPPAAPRPARPHHVFVLSAKTRPALERLAGSLRDALSAGAHDPFDVAYTLASGRRHWPHRAAVVARDTAALARHLADLGETAVVHDKDASPALVEAARRYVAEGTAPEPEGGRHGRIVTLPGHPFDEASYWNDSPEASADAIPAKPSSTGDSPLREVDAADAGTGRRFRLDAGHWWVSEHRYAGRPVLAAATTLAMAHDAARRLRIQGAVEIRDVAWRRPVVPSADGAEILLEEEPGGFRFSVGPAGDRAASPACTGRVRGAGHEPATALEPPDPAVAVEVPTETAYAAFRAAGLDHGEPFRAVRRLTAAAGTVSAELAVEGRVPDQVDPGLLDAAFQAVVGTRPDAEATDIALPAQLGSLVLSAEGLGASARVIAQDRGGPLALALIGDDGRVRASARDFTLGSTRSAAPEPSPVLARRTWSAVENGEPAMPASRTLALAPTGVLDPSTGAVLSGNQVREALAGGEVVVDLTAADEPARIYSQVAGVLRAAAERQVPEAVTLTFTVGESLAWGVAALGSAVELEHPLVRIRTLTATDGTGPVAAHRVRTAALHRRGADGAVERTSLEAVAAHGAAPAWRPRSGTYVVTGGTGHVGRILAAEIVRAGGHVTLLARRAPTPDSVATVGPAAQVAVTTADVTSEREVGEALAAVRSAHGPIRGVVHAAGVESGRSFLEEDSQTADEIIAVKVGGARLLDEATSRDPLDLFVTCASLVGLTGNAGQAAYSFANGWLVGLADERARRVASGERQGRSLAIAWGPWAGGGMAEAVRDRHGLTPIEPGRAVEAWRRCLTADDTCLAVLGSHEDLAIVHAATNLRHDTADRGTGASADTPDAALVELTSILVEELRLPRSQVVPAARLESLGIESVMVAGITARLLQVYANVPKTLFFECRTVGELAAALHALPRKAAAETVEPEPVVEGAEAPLENKAPRTPLPIGAGPQATAEEPGDEGAVAIIGLAGRYPMAAGLGQFWSNLREGRDCVVEVPADRWPLDGFYAPEPEALRSYSKWGGFIDGVDRFDPEFFRIAPAEAAMLDPQERLFLEEAWHAVEDAGYVPADLPRRTGVWAGVMYGEHQLLGAADDGRLASASHASIANRVSYCLDLRGPSMAVDSMCSSSLTALHLAWQSLQLGDADAAIVGGVNLSLHPHKYLQLSLAGFASSDGRCRSFGSGGDGYVPGEGVGAMLLKPLRAALRDGDPVRAVIRGTAANHGGQANGYTVPDPRAQADTIGRALERAGITAGDVSYVEAHGTGTALGDPVEVRGLAAHFGPGLDVPIGSVKSNLGHLESAAGVAALTKVVLQMEHGAIAPSLHGEPANPDIDFANAGVVVNHALAPWTTTPGQPRRALVSSFGAGGSNASLVVEEPPARAEGTAHAAADEVLVLSADTPELLRDTAEQLAEWLEGTRDRVAAAAVEDQVIAAVAESMGVEAAELRSAGSRPDVEVDVVVRGAVEDLVGGALGAPFALGSGTGTLDAVLRAVRSAFAPVGGAAGSSGAPDLAAVAHTLRVGRVARPERLAVVASSRAEAADRLRTWIEGGQDDRCRTGRADASSTAPAAGALSGASARAEAWVRGETVEWATPAAARRVGGLPGRPFRKDRVWLDGARPLNSAGGRVAEEPPEHGTERRVQAEEDEAPAAGTETDYLPRLIADLAARASARIGLDPARLDPARVLGDYGYESLTLKELGAEIEKEYGVRLDASLFYDLRGIGDLAEWMLEEHPASVTARLDRGAAAPGPREATPDTAAAGTPRQGPDHPAADETVPPGPALEGRARSKPRTTASADDVPTDTVPEDAVAVIGLSGRFPKSPDADTFWERLRKTENLLTETPANRWDWRRFSDEEDNIFRWGGYIEDEDCFDAAFFGIDEEEARFIDPQQRLLLQETWAALEDAGYAPSGLAGSDTGLFAGVQFRDYQHLLHEAAVVSPTTATGNEDTFAVNRISYLLDLHGPSEVVNTACSSSLVAVHRAVRSLRSGECAMALAGGVALNLTPYALEALEGLGVVSPHGTSRPLDARADGYVKGEGVGVVVLKPLRAAIRDGDQIHAVIRGSATNHGGRATTITSPNSRAQSALVVAAVKDAGVPVDSVSYIEMHGTGTHVGDPVEVRALIRAFRDLASEQGVSLPAASCGLGSGKASFGHLEPASGIAGLIKLVGSLRHRELYGMPDFEEINPMIALDGTPFRVIDELSAWTPPPTAGVLRAGVSSFGIGGVNAHVVLEEAPQRHREAGPPPPGPWVFPFSAKTEEALGELVVRTADRLAAGAFAPAAVSGTLVHGRDAMGLRCAVVADGLDDLLDGLAELAAAPRHGAVVRTAAGASAARLTTRARSWADGDGDLRDLVGPAHVALPTYPFRPTPHWFGDRLPAGAPAPKEMPVSTPAQPTALTTPAARGNPPGALGPVGDGLRRIVAGVLGRPPGDVGDDVPFKQLGVDSLMSIRVIEAVQDQYSDRLSYSALTDYPTVRLLAAALDPSVPGTPVPALAEPAPAATARPGTGRRASLIPFTRGGEGQPSFWIPGAVGFAAAFTTLAGKLGPRYPFHAFQARGADGRSMPQLWDDMVDDYLAALTEVQPEGPYVIGGHSFGGLTAMALARRLQAAGEEVAQLVMIDTFPPTQEVFDRHRGDYNDAFIIYYLANVLVDAEHHPERTIRESDLEGVPRELHIPTLTKMVHERLGGAGREEDTYHYLRGGLTMSEHSAGLYQVAELKPYDASPVLFIRALDGFVGRSSAVYWPRVDMMQGYDYVQPWRDTIATGLDLVEIDEDHLHVIDGQASDIVAAAVTERLERVGRPGTVVGAR